MSRPPLVQRVKQAADAAVAVCAGTPHEPVARDIRTRLDLPVQVAIAGKVKAGKSTLLNALVGEELAPTNASECTRVVTWYRSAEVCRVTAVPVEGAPYPVAFSRRRALDVDLGGRPPEELRWLLVDWPSEDLRAMTLVDTPGIASLSRDLSARTTAFLDPAGAEASPVDAVVYLMRHVHGEDARLLEAFHDREVGQPNPVNCVGVLSRADEIGVCRLDAMDSAARIARRYLEQPAIRRLCQTIVPVAGLLAQAAVTLREAEFRAISSLAAAGVDSESPLLGSVQEFTAEAAEVSLAAADRRALLERFGLFGVRLGVELTRARSFTRAADLADALTDVSGLSAVRQVLVTQIGNRAGLLKARSALVALERLADASPDVAARLAGPLEQLHAEAHELAELRLLHALRIGAVPLADAAREEAERLLDGIGKPAGVRLGLSVDAPADDVRRALLDALGRWQQRAENPLTKTEAVHACRILVRSIEGMLTDGSGDGRPGDGQPGQNRTATGVAAAASTSK